MRRQQRRRRRRSRQRLRDVACETKIVGKSANQRDFTREHTIRTKRAKVTLQTRSCPQLSQLLRHLGTMEIRRQLGNVWEEVE